MPVGGNRLTAGRVPVYPLTSPGWTGGITYDPDPTMTRLLSLPLTLLLTLGAASGAQGQTPQGGRPGGAPGAAQAQAAGQIRGAVLSGASGQPIANASVAVRSAADSALITGAMTGADGAFRIEGLRPGRYIVRITALGFDPLNRAAVAITPAAPLAQLGQLRLASSAVAIEGISVTGERREVTLAPDRNTYTVRDMPTTTGGNAVDVLRNVPSVEVDGENRVSLRGNQNVVVQINGRPAPMRGEQLGNFLAQLPAGVLDRVEVIPNPSAKYDPEGMAGILNIVMKQNTDLGLSGGVTAGAGSNGQLNGSGNLGYQAGPLTLFGSYGFLRDDRSSTGFNNTEYLFNNTFAEQVMSGGMHPQSHSLTASGDLKVSEKGALASNLILSLRGGEMENLNVLRELDATRTLTRRVDNLTSGDTDDFTFDYALSYRHAFAPRTNELNTELRFNREVQDQLFRYDRQPMLDGAVAGRSLLQTNATDETSSNWTLQSDWTRMFGERTKLEAGYKGVLRQMQNDLAISNFSYDADQYLPDLGRSNSFDFQEGVQAVYGVVSRNIGKFDVQGGVRLESAQTRFDLTTTGESFDNDYTSIFPSALVAFNPDDAHQLKASYSKRIERPHTRMLNPFGFSPDPLNIFRGNPYLKPEYTHAFEVGYQQSFDQGSLQVTPFFRHTTDATRRLREIDADGVSIMSFANVATSDSYGADLNGSLRLGRLTGFGGFSAFQQVTDATNLNADYSNTAFGWSARANASVRLTSTLDAQGFLMYRAPMDSEQGRMSSFSMTNFALRKRIMGDKASIGLRVMDPFNTMGFASVISDPRFYQESERNFEARSVSLTFSYNFGQQPRVRGQRPTEEGRGMGQDDMGGIP